MTDNHFDYDWLVIGSGFGGSVCALRLAEKGYSVGVLECGRRYGDDDFAKSAWNLRRYFWMPKLGMRGDLPDDVVQGRLHRLRLRGRRRQPGIREHALSRAGCVLRGPAVGGMAALGGASCARTTRPPERMLGVTPYPEEGPADLLLREYAEASGVGDSFKVPNVGVFFGEPGVEVEDPYFGGEGPRRTGCLALRQLHDRLPLRRQEHAGQELPLVRREARASRSSRSGR